MAPLGNTCNHHLPGLPNGIAGFSLHTLRHPFASHLAVDRIRTCKCDDSPSMVSYSSGKRWCKKSGIGCVEPGTDRASSGDAVDRRAFVATIAWVAERRGASAH
jgi:hypothetical protein